MDLKMLSLGERIVAASGAVLLVMTFLPWFESSSAWELFGIVDILLAILALTAAAFPLARAAGYEAALRPTNRAILIRVGAVALILILAYFLEALGSAQLGLWLAVIAAAAMFYGASLMPDEGSASRRRDRSRPLRAHENFGEPPPGMEDWRGGAAGGETDEGRGAPLAGGAEEAPSAGSAEPVGGSPDEVGRSRSREERHGESPAAEPTAVRRTRGGPEVPPAADR